MIIETPENGSKWLSDAMIDTEAWLQAIGTEIEVDTDSVNDGELWPQTPEVGEAIMETLLATDPDGVFCEYGNDELREAWTENVYNQENDFLDHFVFTIWRRPDEEEWLYAESLIAVRIGRGGFYFPLRFFRVDNPVDSGFVDWCIGWFVTVDGEQVSQSERCQIGYASNPTCETMRVIAELMREHGNEEVTDDDIRYGKDDSGSWVDGCYVVELADGSVIEAVPYVNAY